ncbi:MAG: Gfo/Idh/MocA family oxidoreductase [Actinomycetota bacterium]|nr:Gfo/Idh/MocA family oxidoreductase [Actinomycetota bacterium]
MAAQPGIGYGLIGCGWVGSAHAWGVAASGDAARLIATSDVDLAAAEQMADRFEAQGAYQDYRELLRRDDIQAVSVCVPDFLHRQVVIDAAQAGKHVLCEKPLAMSVVEADEMMAACETSGVEFGMIMNHRYAPDNIRAKDALAKGAVGGQLIGSVVHSSGLTGPLGTSPWRGKANRAAGGVLSTQAIHFLDLLLWFMGPVRSVKALTDTLHWDIQDHEDTAVLALRLESGALATLTTTNGSPIMDDFTGTRIEVHGTRGWLALEGDVLRHAELAEDFELPSVYLPDVPSDASEIIFGLGHVYEVIDFIHAIRTGTEPPIPARDGRHLMAVIEAAYKSAAEGDEVELGKQAVGYTQPSPPGSLLSIEAHPGSTPSPESPRPAQ